MEWLTQNGIWIALAVAAFFLFRHRIPGGLLGSLGHNHGGHSGLGGQVEHPDTNSSSIAPQASVDPVNGEPVRTDKALTSLYQGRIYYFATKENHDRFEAAPQEFAQKAAGHAVNPTEVAEHRPRRRHGC